MNLKRVWSKQKSNSIGGKKRKRQGFQTALRRHEKAKVERKYLRKKKRKEGKTAASGKMG